MFRTPVYLKKSPGLSVEVCFAGILVYALYRVVEFYLAAGYLPIPFFDEVGDTFMDWYNTQYWGYRGGTYSEWLSVYPPFSFIFLKIFSISECYGSSGPTARECDPVGAWTITIFTAINFILVFLEYWKTDKRNAIPRAIAAGLGMPALFAWERGNLIVPCFTFFILAHGRLLKSTILRWICFAITLNFKPYLAVTVAGRLLRGKWRWAEGCAIVSILLYAVSYMMLGKGSPLELISNIIFFTNYTGTPTVVGLDFVEYATTYTNLLQAIKSQLPLMPFVGSFPLVLLEETLPLVMKVAALGVLFTLAAAVWRPFALSSNRIVALILCLLLTMTQSAGGYAEVFLMFFVFLERWDSPGNAVALISAYLLCIPWDINIVRIEHAIGASFLSGRVVGHDVGVTLGALVRPALLLILQCGLVLASLSDLVKNTARTRAASVDGLDGGPVSVFRVAGA